MHEFMMHKMTKECFVIKLFSHPHTIDRTLIKEHHNNQNTSTVHYLRLDFVIKELLLEFSQSIVCAVVVQVQRIQHVSENIRRKGLLFTS